MDPSSSSTGSNADISFATFAERVRLVLDSPLSATEKLVLIILVSHLPNCFPSYRRMAGQAHLSRRACIKAVRSLNQCGVISVHGRKREGTKERTASRYTVHFDRLVELKGSEPDSPPTARGSERGAPQEVTNVKKPIRRNQEKKRGSQSSPSSPGGNGTLFDDVPINGNGKAVDPRLFELVDSWNALGRSIVSAMVKRDPVSKAIQAGWKKLGREPELRECFTDIPALVGAIRKASYCHGKGWFRLEWLFSKVKTGEWAAVKLLDGAYASNDHNGAPSNDNDQARIPNAEETRLDNERMRNRAG